MNRPKVAIGISGGVDSAVTALLLKQEGFEVVGVHLYCWPPKSEYEKEGISREEWIKKNGCRADEDRQMALKTALELEIPFKVLDFSEEYNQKVIQYFYDEYEAGRTPNPDVMCNSEIKFGLFLKWAMENGFDYIATGHYAKLQRSQESEEVRLFIPSDKHKDQTYFLWKLTQKELKHTLFPLGEFSKEEVRKMAKEANLTVANRKDSQGICFVGNVEAREFLARRLKVKKGVVENTKGEEIGSHDGVWFYTIGQRGGWVIDPKVQKQYQETEETPVFYVIEKMAAENKLVVGLAEEAEKSFFKVMDLNWITKVDLREKLKVRIRHGGELVDCQVVTETNGLLVKIEKALRGVASGQSAVFYDQKGECLGGGIIA